MKKIITIIFAIAIFQIPIIFAQTFDEKKNWVREKYAEVQDNLANYTKKEYILYPDDPTSNGYYCFWLNFKNEVVLAKYYSSDHGYEDTREYYFHNEILFFVYAENCEPNYEPEYTIDCSQSRTYLYEETVFDCLYKEILGNDDRSYIPNERSTGDYNEITISILERAKEILEYLEKCE